MDANANASVIGILSPLRLNITRLLPAAEEDVDVFKQFTEEQKNELYAYRVCAYTVGTLIIVSNLIVVISSGLILKKGSQCKSTFILLGNVSLADTIVGCNVIFGISVSHDATSPAMCAFQIGLIVCPTLVSIFTVGLIAVDRYIYILHGLHYRRWINTTRVRLCIVLVWIVGITLGFMPAAGWAGDTAGGRKCWYITVAPPSLIVVISFFGFLPIVVVVVLYSIILFHALRKVRQLQAGNEHAKRYKETEPELRINSGKTPNKNSPVNIPDFVETRGSINSLSIHTTESSVESDLTTPSSPDVEGSKFQKMINKMRQSNKTDKKKKENEQPNKWRAIKVVLLTTGSFVCTWVPYFIATILYILCNKASDEERCLKIEVAIASPLAILGLMNSLLNPMIYAWWHRGFKTAVKKIFCVRSDCSSSFGSPRASSHL